MIPTLLLSLVLGIDPAAGLGYGGNTAAGFSEAMQWRYVIAPKRPPSTQVREYRDVGQTYAIWWLEGWKEFRLYKIVRPRTPDGHPSTDERAWYYVPARSEDDPTGYETWESAVAAVYHHRYRVQAGFLPHPETLKPEIPLIDRPKRKGK